MPRYETQEAVFDVPQGCVDGSVTALEYLRPAGGTYRIAVVRSAPEGKTLTALVDDRLVEQRRKLSFFEPVRREERLVAGLPCVELVGTYQEEDARVYQRALCTLVRGQFVVLAVLGALAHKDELDSVFDGAVGTLRLRKDQESEAGHE
jgi:hypothetical protein